MFKLNRGFTLIEMMVSVAIITFITAIVLYDYRTFNDNLSLTTAQQEISIVIRQAEIYGLSVKENKVSGSDFSSAYGIYLKPSDPTSYYLFVDIQNGINPANDGIYEGTNNCSAGPSPECLEKDIIRSGAKITSVCGTPYGGGGQDCTYTSMSVTFLRPSPSAKIIFQKSAGGFTGLMKTGQIKLTSSLGKVVNIIVENTGQIYVQ